MWRDADFVDLTLVAAFYMGAVRAMLSNISFVYENYYKMNTFATGILISVPTACGFFRHLPHTHMHPHLFAHPHALQ